MKNPLVGFGADGADGGGGGGSIFQGLRADLDG